MSLGFETLTESQNRIVVWLTMGIKRMKFAYMIMAHNNQAQLELLLKLLDAEENDIFLHIDKKNKDINDVNIRRNVKRAKIHVYRKYKVYHADISQTKCQIYLLEEASKTFHDYYHLISNADLPLKNNNVISSFFENNKGKQFIHFEDKAFCNKDNCIYYHFFFSWHSAAKSRMIRCCLEKMEDISLAIQKRIKVNREFYCGANWYSITHELARDFCLHRKEILKKVRWTICSDELVLQTFVRCISQNKYFIYKETDDDSDYTSLERAIDWKRGEPYVWRSCDYDELMSSTSLFARKFDSNIDKDIVIRISDYLLMENEERKPNQI